MKKYDAWFCHCGTIQLMPNDYYDWLAEDFANRYILRVCQRCGTVRRIWLSEGLEEGFYVNGCDMENFELKPEDLQNCRIIFDKGIRVPVKDGDYATCYFANTYFDDEGHRGADTERLIREVKDEDKLRSISGYITGIDWKGTPYDYDLLLKGTDEK